MCVYMSESHTSLTGDLPSVRSGRQGCVRVCLSLTGDLPSVRSGRQGVQCMYMHTHAIQSHILLSQKPRGNRCSEAKKREEYDIASLKKLSIDLRKSGGKLWRRRH